MDLNKNIHKKSVMKVFWSTAPAASVASIALVDSPLEDLRGCSRVSAGGHRLETNP